MSAMIKNFNLEQVAVAVAAPPSPPPLPPAKKPKQGIGSILGSDSDHRAKTAASIRRTLSADMSSKKWLSQNGFPAMKKIASSGEFADDHPHPFSGEEDQLSRPGQDEVWRAIQAAQKPRNDGVKPSLRSCESWSSILTTKNTEDCSKLPPPYVHPLVKARTASSLSEKSLEICTESLGSETGSDGFSSHSPPESGDEEEEQEEEKQDHNLQIPNNYSHSFEAPQAVKQSYSKRSAPPRSFPPPLPSLAKNKASLQVLSRRQNGRLILEAVSVPPRDYLHAQRHDGRLLLTLVNGSASEETGDKDETTQLFDSFEETDDTVLIDDEDEQELTKNSNLLPNIPAPPFMKQFKKNTLWFNNKAVDLIEEEDLIITPPPPPQAAAAGVAGLIPVAALPHAAAFVNTYDYFWRKKPTVASVIFDTEQCKGGAKNNLKNNNDDNNNNVVESPKVALLRGSMANNMLRGCKESRRSLLPWEPYCIATT
nr:protein FAF-like, chloroplastic [Ipomoea trifida]